MWPLLLDHRKILPVNYIEIIKVNLKSNKKLFFFLSENVNKKENEKEKVLPEIPPEKTEIPTVEALGDHPLSSQDINCTFNTSELKSLTPRRKDS